MITYWKYDTCDVQDQDWTPNAWVRVDNPTADELDLLESRWQAPLDFVRDAADADERPRVDDEDQWLAVIVRIPSRSVDADGDTDFHTRPLAILMRADVLITVSFFDNEVLDDFVQWSNRRHQPERRGMDMVLSMLLSSSVWYLKYLKQMNIMMKQVETRLEKSMDNDELLKMMGLGKYLIYFITSLRGNEVVLMRLKKRLRSIPYDEDLLYDVDIEMQQAYDTANIYSQILDRQQSSYSSVIGNNMNVIMRTLTVITIILMVPTGIAGFYGMNVPNGMEAWAWGFLFALALSVIFSVLIYVYLKRKRLI
ncbi:MAG: magnesium transporter CorA family protein [Muribaculaceae bacterium]|nr:magnesium transporter CorA family protein [Muribaculaceae bacterium]